MRPEVRALALMVTANAAGFWQITARAAAGIAGVSVITARKILRSEPSWIKQVDGHFELTLAGTIAAHDLLPYVPPGVRAYGRMRTGAKPGRPQGDTSNKRWDGKRWRPAIARMPEERKARRGPLTRHIVQPLPPRTGLLEIAPHDLSAPVRTRVEALCMCGAKTKRTIQAIKLALSRGHSVRCPECAKGAAAFNRRGRVGVREYMAKKTTIRQV